MLIDNEALVEDNVIERKAAALYPDLPADIPGVWTDNHSPVGVPNAPSDRRYENNDEYGQSIAAARNANFGP